ncbi:MAG: hypothetical protein KDJ88_00695 [Bauldia sp.]|nr:hypothetical protein [Bauldia sp.]
MKISKTVAFLVGVGALISAAVPAAADPQRVIDAASDRRYLFTMSAVSGSFAEDMLTLDGVPLVVYFTDRPYRQAGQMSLEDFMALWQGDAEDLSKDPPNAELAVYSPGGDTHSVLIVNQPEVGDGSLSFHVKILDETLPATFGHATLFIDAFPCAVNGC